MSRPLVLGDVMFDVVARLSGPLAPGSDTHAVIRFHGGGSAANTAAWLAEAGAEPVLVGRVGDDDAGRSPCETNCAPTGSRPSLTVDPELPTGTCIVLVGPDGERTMAPDAGANDALSESDLTDELLASVGHLHVAGYALLRSGLAARGARGDLAGARARGSACRWIPPPPHCCRPSSSITPTAPACCCRTPRRRGC